MMDFVTIGTAPASQVQAVTLNRLTLALARHWLLIVNLLLAVFVILPWLAPVFMKLGWTGAADAVYLAYATQCHQLPQRSFFLFGPRWMYSLSEIQQAWQVTDNPMLLRQFVGSPAMGWKVAWSDRMVAMWTSLLIGGLLYWPWQKRLKPLPLWAAALFALPMALDGGTHLISDLAGIGNGFRDSNAWLAVLTANTFPATFYAGDAFGSFNSWMRLLSGLLFGLGLVWLAYPYLHEWFNEVARKIKGKLLQAGILADLSGLE